MGYSKEIETAGGDADVVSTSREVERLTALLDAHYDPPPCARRSERDWVHCLGQELACEALGSGAWVKPWIQHTATGKLLRAWAKDRNELRNLLARVHRDGGDYIAMHGLEKSIEDAHKIIANAVVK